MSTLPPAAPPEAIFAAYRPLEGVYDEMFAAPASVRPHCERFMAGLERLGQRELSNRWEQARRLLRENGITYTAYGDPDDRPRPWELDALPLLISAQEFRRAAEALVQRARLMNLILADLYGPQTLLARGLVPPELVYGHPGFLRPCHGIRVPGDVHLHVHAVDVARSPDGGLWAVADRTDAPVGAGYALENRLVISRMLPGLFHDCRVERLAAYFLGLRNTLRRLAPAHRDNPRIVLLTPGPQSRSYFEDAYLARYLGYTLVESGDLAVRDDRVLLKTLAGLLPVDVILRRQEEHTCDPLDLRGDSSLGVAGLLQAVRAGHVAVANALGAGLVESPALLAFLPAICRAVLGEDLKMPSVATWWCGEASARQFVLEHLSRLIIKPAYRRLGRPPWFGAQLDARARRELAAAIAARPAWYVGQEPVLRSCSPVWTPSGMRSAHVSWRAFLVASGDSYEPMTGGLARVSACHDALDVSITAGDGSKDAWVLAEREVSQLSLLPMTTQTVALRRTGAELPSRVADNLYWLGRQVERADAAARLARAVLLRLAGEAEVLSLREVPVLLRVLAEQGQIEPGYVVEGMREPLPPIEQALPTTIFDAAQPGSVRSTLTRMYRLASVVRDRISIDSWRLVHRIDREFNLDARRPAPDVSDALSRINQLIIDLAAIGGMVMEAMTRGLSWRFLDIGRRLERTLHTIGLLRFSLGELSHDEGPVLEAILEVADSSMTYRSRYMAQLQRAPVLDLLLTDETNPRSVAFQLVALLDHVERLPHEAAQPLRRAEQRMAMAALHRVRMLSVHDLSEPHRPGRRARLDRLLEWLESQMPKLADQISHRYLIHAGQLRQLAELPAGEPP
jgi:uncharacterized circularly permuted ATP-grasp superfamily protein/uncharacterized alpha-E superfamily protein